MPLRYEQKNAAAQPGRGDTAPWWEGLYDDDRTPAKRTDLTPNRAHWIAISSGALHWDIFMMLGEGEIAVSGGGGGWGTVARPDDKSITEWTGVEPWALSIPIMLDAWTEQLDLPNPDRRKQPPKKSKPKEKRRWRNFRDRHEPRNVPQYIELLNLLSQPEKGGRNRTGRDEPPVIRVYGKNLPFWLNGEKFVIQNIAWGRRLIDRESGVTKRQALTLDLLEHTKSDDIRIKKVKQRNKGKGGEGKNRGDGGREPKIYVVKDGQTLKDVAKDVYGDWRKWKKIADYNNIRNARSVEAGDKLKIP